MNPLGLAPERFVIVQDDQRAKILGIGQMQPQGSFQELRTLIVEPECRQVLLPARFCCPGVQHIAEQPVFISS